MSVLYNESPLYTHKINFPDPVFHIRYTFGYFFPPNLYESWISFW